MKVKLFLLAITFSGLFLLLYQILVKDNEEMISENEAQEVALDLYNGSILDSKLNKKKKHYMIEVENDKGIYRLIVDGKSKKVSNVKQIEKNTSLASQSLEKAAKKIIQESGGNIKDIVKSKNNKSEAEAIVERDQKKLRIVYDLEKQKIVSTTELEKSASAEAEEKKQNTPSKQQIKKIALEQLDGKISNIVKTNSKNGVLYKVTVENESEGAHVYVQEATKAVTSVSWFSKDHQENDDQDDDDDDDD